MPLLGGVAILAKIAQGKEYAVYYGIHFRHHKELAVKAFRFDFGTSDPGNISLFFKKWQIAAKIRSPKLVSVKDVEEESGVFFVAMEFINGDSSSLVLREARTTGMTGLPEPIALDISISATEGLSAAHAKNFVHNKIDVDNILVPRLSLNGAESKYDYKNSKLINMGSNEGQGEKVADVLCMCETLCELLVGKKCPKGGTQSADVYLKYIKDSRHDISDLTVTLIANCLGKVPGECCENASDLLTSLIECRENLENHV